MEPENFDESQLPDDAETAPVAEKPLQENPYEIDLPALSLYFHLAQFLPALVIVFAICLFVKIATSLTLVPIAAVAFLIYVALYKISSVLAERRANSVVYSLANNVLTSEEKCCGFFSQKSVQLQQVARITLVQTPLMRYCKIWAIEFEALIGNSSKVCFYGLAEATRVRESLITARAKVLNKQHGKA